MFGRGQDMAQATVTTTLIAQGTEIDGDISFAGELEVQGLVRGCIRAREGGKARVRVVEAGAVEGEIHAPEVLINGRVTGDVHAAEHVELAAKAEVDGDVYYQFVEMVRGARINGKLIHAQAASPGAAPAVAGDLDKVD